MRRKIVQKGFDVLKDATTIAGAAMRIYRAKFLKEKHLAIVPEGGFEKNDSQSVVAIKYFEWCMHKNGAKGRHAGNGREIEIGGFKVDFICNKSKTIIEFQGCAFHGI
uniref:Uncharacterized protein n=1 Tax=Globodera rostochiensis TaxID=31243 RepID=A0A914GVK3_GLORO